MPTFKSLLIKFSILIFTSIIVTGCTDATFSAEMNNLRNENEALRQIIDNKKIEIQNKILLDSEVMAHYYACKLVYNIFCNGIYIPSEDQIRNGTNSYSINYYHWMIFAKLSIILFFCGLSSFVAIKIYARQLNPLLEKSEEAKESIASVKSILSKLENENSYLRSKNIEIIEEAKMNLNKLNSEIKLLEDAKIKLAEDIENFKMIRKSISNF